MLEYLNSLPECSGKKLKLSFVDGNHRSREYEQSSLVGLDPNALLIYMQKARTDTSTSTRCYIRSQKHEVQQRGGNLHPL